MCYSNKMINTIRLAINNLIKYKGLSKQLIQRDIKLRYRRSVLGYVWSVLNPLMIMIVMTIVFSTFFRFSIQNFPVYLLCGNIVFNFFSSSTTSSCYTIIENGSLIRKTYVPKYIFVFAKVTSCFVDFFFSLAALILVMIITKSHFSFYNLLFIIPALEIYVFSLGVALFISQATVFFRDVVHIYAVVITIMSYLTPLFYPIEILPDNLRPLVERFNPLYLFVKLFRDCVYSGTRLNLHQIMYGGFWALGAFVIGALFFKKNQDRFILYI